MKSIPAPLMTVYTDFLDSAVSSPPASAGRRTVNGQEYLKANERHGPMRITRHLGRADDPDAQTEARRLKRDADFANAQQSLVGALRRAGIPAPPPPMGRALEVLANAGLFDDRGVVVGTVAYIS